jgi:hypothetical protein
MSQVEMQTKALILNDDLRPWIEEHGLVMKYVRSASIQIRPDGRGAAVWLEAQFYKLDDKGEIYVEYTPEPMAAMGTCSIPLKSWPPLTLVEEAVDER